MDRIEECWCCGKKEEYPGEFYVGPCPYAKEMCITDEEVAELPDEVLCSECYSNKVQDV